MHSIIRGITTVFLSVRATAAFFFFLDVFACLQQLSELPNAFCRASASDSCS